MKYYVQNNGPGNLKYVDFLKNNHDYPRIHTCCSFKSFFRLRYARSLVSSFNNYSGKYKASIKDENAIN